MPTRAQQQRNINDTFDGWGRFVDFWRKSMPNNKRKIVNYAYAAQGKRNLW